MGIRENIKLSDIIVKHGITIDQIQSLEWAMHNTWSQIYTDIVNCFEDENDLHESYKDEAEMIAENTLDADRVTTFCPDIDLKWVYRLDDGEYRLNVLEMGEDILRSTRG
tara:strand:+ start:388 stop:717 length:330 start_codon:yes stop_codon:yes gene_type:complete